MGIMACTCWGDKKSCDIKNWEKVENAVKVVDKEDVSLYDIIEYIVKCNNLDTLKIIKNINDRRIIKLDEVLL